MSGGYVHVPNEREHRVYRKEINFLGRTEEIDWCDACGTEVYPAIVTHTPQVFLDMEDPPADHGGNDINDFLVKHKLTFYFHDGDHRDIVRADDFDVAAVRIKYDGRTYRLEPVVDEVDNWPAVREILDGINRDTADFVHREAGSSEPIGPSPCAICLNVDAMHVHQHDAADDPCKIGAVRIDHDGRTYLRIADQGEPLVVPLHEFARKLQLMWDYTRAQADHAIRGDDQAYPALVEARRALHNYRDEPTP